MNVEGKITLITGASRGIGKAIAEAFAAKGAKVLGTATSEEGAKNITNYLAGRGEGLVFQAGKEGAVKELSERVTSDYGTPSILINNAAINRDGLFMRMSEEAWSEVLRTNLDAVFSLTQSFIRPMIKANEGCIINLSSIVAFSGNAGQTNYCASKAGLLGFTKALAQEVASKKIRVNAIAPGFIATDMTDKLPDAIKTGIMAKIPMGAMGKAEDIAQAALFLAEGGDYITGQTLHVNGGMLMP